MSKNATKRAGQAIGNSVQALAREILAEARNTLTDGKKPDAIVIHDFRRAMKRWRALLRLLEPELGPQAKVARRAARDLAREVANARDVQSAIDALHDIGNRGPQAPRSLKPIADRLHSHRAAMEKAHLDAAKRKRFLRALDAAASFVQRWPTGQMTFDQIIGRLTRMYRRARRAIPDSWSRARAKDLHKLRRRVVDFRYQMELLEPLWPRLGRAWIREAQSLRGELGCYQDLVMLARLTEPDQPLAPWRSRLLSLIAKRQAEHVAEARSIAARLFAEPPKIFRRRFEALWAANAKIQ